MLYVHIPYCHHRCTYCAFYSRASHGVEDAYVDALCSELAMRAGELCKEEGGGDTLYLGGGTPSLLLPHQLSRLKDTLCQQMDTTKLQESTLECNPENLTLDYLSTLQELRLFNRLSIGIQSFRDDDLRLLNRAHNARQAISAVLEAQHAGFRNISIDLIYGLPGQTLQSWKDNLAIAGDMHIQHLSCYALAVEHNTMLEKQIAAGRTQPADEEVVMEQYNYLLEWAAENGFRQYEISNFCKPGHHAIHNSRYWRRRPYVGVGAAAHSFQGNIRRWNVADITNYILGVEQTNTGNQTSRYYFEERLTERDAYNEFIMLGLRTMNGICKSSMPSALMPVLRNAITPFLEKGLLQETVTHIIPTPQGLLQADGIAAELFL